MSRGSGSLKRQPRFGGGGTVPVPTDEVFPFQRVPRPEDTPRGIVFGQMVAVAAERLLGTFLEEAALRDFIAREDDGDWARSHLSISLKDRQKRVAGERRAQ